MKEQRKQEREQQKHIADAYLEYEDKIITGIKKCK